MTDPPPASGNANDRPHALIVSDDADLGAFLAEGLLFEGFWTSTIASAIQTIEVFRLRTFDLVLIDLDLGGFGALELVRRLRGPHDHGSTTAPTPPPRTVVPIVLIVADPATRPPAASETIGIDDVVVAPFDLDELAPRLHGIVAKDRSRPSRTAAPGFEAIPETSS